MTADEGWVTDPRAIKTLIALKAIRKGDEIECGNDCALGHGTRGVVTYITSWGGATFYYNGHLYVCEEHICAWRRPR